MPAKRLLTLLAALISCLGAHAGQFPVPSVEFSGDMKMEAMGMTMDSKVYMARDKQRMEMRGQEAGMNMIMIIRHDKKVAWNLMPEQKMFSEINIEETKKQSGDFSSCSYDASGSSSDSVNGIAAKKSHAKVKCPDVEYEGDFWVTPEGITVKMDVKGKAKDGSPVEFKSEMKSLSIGSQSASLFEIPAGYHSMGNMNDLFKDAQRQMEDARRQQAEAEKRAAEDEKRRQAQEAERAKAEENARKEEGRSYTGKERSGQDTVPTNVEDAVKGGLKKLFKW